MLPSNLSLCSTRLIHVCKRLPLVKDCRLHWIAGRADVLSKYITSMFLSFGRGFFDSFPMFLYFQKLQLLFVTQSELIFPALYFYTYELKKSVSDF